MDAEGWISLSTPADRTSTNHYVLKWEKQDGSTLTQALVITVSVKGGKPTVAAPEKDDNMNAFEAIEEGIFRLNRLAASLMTVDKNKDGVKGWMNIRLKNTTGIPSVTWTDDLEEAHYLVELPVPEGAVTVKSLELPETIFEPIDEDYFREFIQNSLTADSQDSVAGKTTFVHDESLLKNMTPGNSRIAVYYPYISADEDRGIVRVFYFYDQAGNRLNNEGLYVVLTVSELGTLITTDVIPSKAICPIRRA